MYQYKVIAYNHGNKVMDIAVLNFGSAKKIMMNTAVICDEMYLIDVYGNKLPLTLLYTN